MTTSSLLSIATSGLTAASTGLDVTSQNIANAGTTGYVREMVNQTDLSSPQSDGVVGNMAMSGVLVTGITRNVDPFQQQQLWSTAASAAGADANVTNLTDVENAVEQSNVYSSITTFQSSLEALAANPTSTSLRANVLADAQSMAQSFNLASTSLSQAAQGMQQTVTSGVSTVNTIAQNLAQLNLQIATDTNPATNSPSLFDRRDALLGQLSQYTGFNATIATDGTVSVTLGGTSGASLVNGGTANTLSSTQASDGTVSYTLGGSAVSLSGGSLTAAQQGLAAYVSANTSLDKVASSLISTANSAQGAGTDLNGNTGAAMFSGTGAGNIAVAISSGNQIAAAAAGSAAGSQDISNLTALQNALNTNGIATNTNSLLFSLSSATASATTTKTALDTISAQAQKQFSTTSGVDLNTEAANLLQYQQAFQASSQVINIASTLFNQLLQLQ